jgi:hypothetical protein
MHPTVPSPSDPHAARPRLPWPTLAGTAVLTVVAILVGQRDWAVPERVLRDWQVTAVPPSLTALVLGLTATCLLAAAALIRNALVMAADGFAARGLGAGRAVAAALGTGVVTLPLFGLGWSLFSPREAPAAGIGNSSWTTAILGAVTLVIAAAIARSSALSNAWTREHPVR